jgi:isopentenyl-diphosphate delta-isomerase
LNYTLAEVANEKKLALGLGSQRILIEHPELEKDFAVRHLMPDGVLLGNIGAIQLKEFSVEQIAELMGIIEADGMCIHLNAAQEIIQAEDGQQSFSDILDGIARLMDRLDGKILVKETGAGLSPQCLERLKSIGVKYIDVSGAGGTSWTRVESLRTNDEIYAGIGELLGDWGVPTAFSIIAARNILGDSSVIVGSGGVRNGLDMVRAIVAGSNLTAMARPVLMAYLDRGMESVMEFVEKTQLEFLSTMFLTGADSIEELQKAPRIYTGRLREWLQTYGWENGVSG